jgi:glycosyltransferase involved in cell wall biosynthesis
MAARPVAGTRVLVDMTPLEPNGANGGAGLVATSLVRHLRDLAPGWDFTLLTSSATHDELGVLDAPNVRRACVVQRRSIGALRGALEHLLPTETRVRVKAALGRLRWRRQLEAVPESTAAALLFCPFTMPYFWQPGVRCVSIVYDLQHLTYPGFFTAEQRLAREHHVVEACRRSARVVCISDYVRSTLLSGVRVPPERVETIHLAVLNERTLPDVSVFARLGIGSERFLLYPANFWPHKNHARLFEALRAYRAAHGSAALPLVLTGAPNPLMAELEQRARRELDPEAVVFAGYVPPAELTALLESCTALVFPSLYEGFGMPVLEAMAAGRPVACSNVTSLPEIAGDAAVYFDPTTADEIADALHAVAHNSNGQAARVARGRQQAATFGDANLLAQRYYDVLREVLRAPC